MAVKRREGDCYKSRDYIRRRRENPCKCSFSHGNGMKGYTREEIICKDFNFSTSDTSLYQILLAETL